MRGQGEQPTQQRRTGRGSRNARSQARGQRQPSGPDETRSHTGVFSTVGAEPRSSWTIPGATVIPNPSVDPGGRSWVDPDAVPGVLGPPQANPTSHGDDELPGMADRAEDDLAPSNPAPSDVSASPQPGASAPVAAPSSRAISSRLATAAIDQPGAVGAARGPALERCEPGDSVFRRGQTGLIDLSRDPRARLAGMLVVVVLLVLLVGRIGDLAASVSEAGEALANWVVLGPG